MVYAAATTVALLYASATRLRADDAEDAAFVGMNPVVEVEGSDSPTEFDMRNVTNEYQMRALTGADATSIATDTAVPTEALDLSDALSQTPTTTSISLEDVIDGPP